MRGTKDVVLIVLFEVLGYVLVRRTKGKNGGVFVVLDKKRPEKSFKPVGINRARNMGENVLPQERLFHGDKRGRNNGKVFRTKIVSDKIKNRVVKKRKGFFVT